ncbi:MAG: flagellar basal body rod protein FlgC [Candidatus Berkiella sp.]
MSSFSIFDIAGQGMSAQNIRLNAIASNIANAESVGNSESETFKAKYPVFAPVNVNVDGETGENSIARGVKVVGMVHGKEPVQMNYDPSNPKADENGFVYISNVNVVQEMADMISASRSFQMNVQLLNTGKELMQHALNLGK